MQGFEMGKKGVEAIQGFEVEKQSRDIGKKSVDMSKQGYSKTKKFARKGVRTRGEKGKVDGGSLEGQGSREGGKAIEGCADGNDDEEGYECDDDARSVFSLGEFAELGDNDF